MEPSNKTKKLNENSGSALRSRLQLSNQVDQNEILPQREAI